MVNQTRQTQSNRNHWHIFITLVLLSFFSLALVAARVLFSGRVIHLFLLWNLFLAWLPLLFAWLALIWRKRPLFLLGAALLWLLFFPNAPYLVTDLIHLRDVPPVPLWYDLILLLDFALLGLYLGFISLRIMHGLVNGRLGSTVGWIFVLFVLAAGGLGVYIGRFLRWNSWDIFTRPFLLLSDVWSQLAEPRTIAVSGLLATLMLFAYIFIFMAPGQFTDGRVVNKGERYLR